MKEKIDHQAFLEGEKAYEQGLPIAENPYQKENPLPWDAKKISSWHKGWIYKKSRVELYPRRKALEQEQERFPDVDLSEKWLQLAKDFEEVEDPLNIGHAMMMYRRHMRKAGRAIPAEYQEKLVGKPFDVDLDTKQYDWQTNRKDTK